MITYGELREIGMTFRGLSSNFLNSGKDNAGTLIQRFKIYIDTTPFISDLLNKVLDGVDYDYNECFIWDAHAGWSGMSPPVDEACHIKAMYDYMTYIIQNNANVLGTAMSYYHSKMTYDEIIRNFLCNAFKPLVDYIRDAISKEMIIMEEAKKNASTMTQNIENVHGTVIQQGASGNITSYTNVVNSERQAILVLIEKILPSLNYINDVPDDVLDDIKDDLLSVDEQLKSQTPKKSRLQKALAGIKKFSCDFAVKLAASLAAKGVSQADWADLIQRIEAFLGS